MTSFWATISELSTRRIRDEVNRRFYLGLAGEFEAVRRAERVMFGSDATPEQIRLGREFLEPRTTPFSREALDRLSLCHLVVSLKNGPAIVDLRPAPVVMVSHPHDLIPTLLEARPDWRIAMARHFPGFREPVVDRLVADVSRINAEFAVLYGIPEAIPIIPPIMPVFKSAELLVLTKNQILLVCRLAAAFGLDIDPKQRIPEILPVLGGALGWRALARQLAGLLPIPVGPVLNASIAYTGTYVIGKAAEHYFREGQRPSRERMRMLYDEAAERAKSVVAHAMEKVRRVPRVTEPPPAGLPPSTDQEAEEEEASI